jgi:hypothetical protein
MRATLRPNGHQQNSCFQREVFPLALKAMDVMTLNHLSDVVNLLRVA